MIALGLFFNFHGQDPFKGELSTWTAPRTMRGLSVRLIRDLVHMNSWRRPGRGGPNVVRFSWAWLAGRAGRARAYRARVRSTHTRLLTRLHFTSPTDVQAAMDAAPLITTTPDCRPVIASCLESCPGESPEAIPGRRLSCPFLQISVM